MHKAALRKHVGIVTVLLARDKDLIYPQTKPLVNCQNVNGESALHQLAKRSTQQCDDEAVSSILSALSKAGADFSLRSRKGETFFHVAAAHGNVEFFDACQSLAKSGIIGNVISMRETDNEGNTHLHLAAFNGSAILVENLIGLGGELERKNGHDQPPIHCAIERGHYQTAIFLYEKGASLASRGKNGQSLYHVILAKAELSKAALHFLTSLRSRVGQLCLKADKNASTPLHLIATNNHCKAFDLLFREPPLESRIAKSYFLQKNDSDKTAVEIAHEKNFRELALQLVNYSLSTR